MVLKRERAGGVEPRGKEQGNEFSLGVVISWVMLLWGSVADGILGDVMDAGGFELVEDVQVLDLWKVRRGVLWWMICMLF